MSSKRVELKVDELENVAGGQITYTWDGESGSLGIDGYNPYILVDKEAFLDYYNEAKDTTSEMDMIHYMKKHGIIRKP